MTERDDLLQQKDPILEQKYRVDSRQTIEDMLRNENKIKSDIT